MKKSIVAFSILMSCVMMLGGCSKGDSLGLKKVSDVTKQMKDPKFIEYCLTYFDKDNNGKLSMEEVELVDRLDFTDMELNLTSLAGIEYFTGLTWLDCENNQLTELDLSYNYNLSNLYCSRNQLTSLIFPKPYDGSSWTSLSVVHCSQNQLTEINLSRYFNLVRLSCWDNQLVSLNLSEVYGLQELNCSMNRLSGKLDLRDNKNITELDCSFNESLTDLWLYEFCLTSGLTKDEQTIITRHDYNNIPIKIGIPDQRFKDYLLSICDANDNGVISSEEAATVTEIDMADVSSGYYEVESLEGIEHFVNLEKFQCSDRLSQCKVLDFSKNTALKYLDLSLCWNLETLYLIEGHTYDTLNLPQTEQLEIIYK